MTVEGAELVEAPPVAMGLIAQNWHDTQGTSFDKFSISEDINDDVSIIGICWNVDPN